jgi:hypothetical protein
MKEHISTRIGDALTIHELVKQLKPRSCKILPRHVTIYGPSLQLCIRLGFRDLYKVT